MKTRIYSAILFVLVISCAKTFANSEEITLVKDGKPNAAIIIAKNSTVAANLAAVELQYHIEKITGATLPIKSVNESLQGNRILVGESEATKKLGLKSDNFNAQEYLIRFLPETIILIGHDQPQTKNSERHKIDYAAATNSKNTKEKTVTLPDIFDHQGTCYAAYDFLERFCDVRWYGPTELNVVFPSRKTLTIKGFDVRRTPDMEYRHWGEGLGRGPRRNEGGPILANQWNDATVEQKQLYHRRLRSGGVNKYACHSFYGYHERFDDTHPEYFSKNGSQLCYTNEALIKQVVQDARDYFNGKNFDGQIRKGARDFFVLCPMDNSSYCKCDNCVAEYKNDADIAGDFFSSGKHSNYWYDFVNKIAREIHKSHPHKWISSLAYANYAHYPDKIKLEPNIIITPCLHSRSYWNPNIERNDMQLYKAWVNPKDRPVYLWNYYCFPNERAAGWNCFPGFSFHSLAEQLKMYHQDGIRGIYLCGIGDQLDFYLSIKMQNDKSIDTDDLFNEFFSRYFGAASEPMKNFYLKIEETYHNYDNYKGSSPLEDMHQVEEIAWKHLGTDQRMEELGELIRKAKTYAVTDLEKKRVALWEEGVWDYMVEGKKMYLAKKN